MSGGWTGASVTHTELQRVAERALRTALAGNYSLQLGDIHQCLVVTQFLRNAVVDADSVQCFHVGPQALEEGIPVACLLR